MNNNTASRVLPEGYSAEIYRTPMSSRIREMLGEFLNHKDDIFQRDIEIRLRNAPSDLVGLAFAEGQPAAHACLARSHPTPEVALLCHVFTAEKHRQSGLATYLLTHLFRTFDAEGGRWTSLGTTNPHAERLYRRLGFQPLNGSLDDENFIMIRTASAVSPESYLAGGDNWQIVPFQRHHAPGAILLLNLEPSPAKLPLCNIDRGLKAEQELVKVIYDQEQGKCRSHVLIDAARGRVRGFACTVGNQTDVYAPNVPEEEKANLRRAAQEDQG